MTGIEGCLSLDIPMEQFIVLPDCDGLLCALSEMQLAPCPFGVVESMWGLEPRAPFLLFPLVLELFSIQLDFISDGYVDGWRADVRKLGLGTTARNLLVGTTTGIFAPLPNSLPSLPHDSHHNTTTTTNTTTDRPTSLKMISSAAYLVVAPPTLLTLLLFYWLGSCALGCLLRIGIS